MRGITPQSTMEVVSLQAQPASVTCEVDVDWDSGLPPDVLALVAKAGGVSDTKSMREVSKSWQQGFELGVTGIAIVHTEHPVLPPVLEVAQRFPGLTRLDLSRSATNAARLGNVRVLPKLESLVLGHRNMTCRPEHVGIAAHLV